MAKFTRKSVSNGKTISDEQMKLTIIINGDAQKRTFDLEKKYRSYGGKQGHLLQKLLIKQ
jgi:hypothetical protein